jgi:small subunit ribosomal protein S8e
MSTRWHSLPRRAATGAKTVARRKKKAFERGSMAAETKMGATRKSAAKSLGGKRKIRMLFADSVIFSDPKTGKCHKAKIMTVVENRANTHYVRRNIITKGAIIKTDAGLVRVTSRPGQCGVVQGVKVADGK